MAQIEKIIIDTDAGGDPDDTLAIALACTMPNLLAYITSDETNDGGRSKLVRALVGQDGVPVFTGAPSPNPGKHLLDRLSLDNSLQPQRMRDELLSLVDAQRDDNLLWVGIGSYTNLAWLYDKRPHLADSMRVVLMGGRMNYNEGDRPEHNFKVDPDAAVLVATRVRNLTYVPATTTMHERTRVDAEHPFINYLSSGQASWQTVARENFNVWFEERFDSSYQHDALTLAIAVGALHGLTQTPVRVSREGGLTEDDTSHIHAVTGGVDYDAFWQWTWDTLKPPRDAIQKDQS